MAQKEGFSGSPSSWSAGCKPSPCSMPPERSSLFLSRPRAATCSLQISSSSSDGLSLDVCVGRAPPWHTGPSPSPLFFPASHRPGSVRLVATVPLSGPHRPFSVAGPRGMSIPVPEAERSVCTSSEQTLPRVPKSLGLNTSLLIYHRKPVRRVVVYLVTFGVTKGNQITKPLGGHCFIFSPAFRFGFSSMEEKSFSCHHCGILLVVLMICTLTFHFVWFLTQIPQISKDEDVLHGSFLNCYSGDFPA